MKMWNDVNKSQISEWFLLDRILYVIVRRSRRNEKNLTSRKEVDLELSVLDLLWFKFLSLVENDVENGLPKVDGE